MAKLSRHAKLAKYFDLKTIKLTAERRDEAYYGIITMDATEEAFYRVIAFERLLTDVEYGFCERCDRPFRVTSRHKRKYCETDSCGHAVAQQAYREREKL